MEILKNEVRILTTETAELRAEDDGKKIGGYAIVFNKQSRRMDGHMEDGKERGGFFELIKPEAMNGVVKRSLVLALLDHNTNKVLARSRFGQGSLKLEVDPKGVRYVFESPDTVSGQEALEAIRRKDITTSSFSFTVMPGGQEWKEQEDGSYLRTITQFNMLFDVSPVYGHEAYSDTTAAKRSLDEAIAGKSVSPPDLKQKQLVDDYLNPLKDQMDNLKI